MLAKEDEELLDLLGQPGGKSAAPDPSDVVVLAAFLTAALDRLPKGERIDDIQINDGCVDYIHLRRGKIAIEYTDRTQPGAYSYEFPEDFAMKRGAHWAREYLPEIRQAVKRHIARRGK